jgi:hypothetical protein
VSYVLVTVVAIAIAIAIAIVQTADGQASGGTPGAVDLLQKSAPQVGAYLNGRPSPHSLAAARYGIHDLHSAAVILIQPCREFDLGFARAVIGNIDGDMGRVEMGSEDNGGPAMLDSVGHQLAGHHKSVFKGLNPRRAHLSDPWLAPGEQTQLRILVS